MNENNEVRLIDANKLKARLSNLEGRGGHKYYRKAVDDCLHKHFPHIIDDAPSIDPETLPIVRKMREELEQAKSERDAAFELIGWIYYEACVSVEHDMKQHIDWLKDKIEEWKKNRRK